MTEWSLHLNSFRIETVEFNHGSDWIPGHPNTHIAPYLKHMIVAGFPAGWTTQIAPEFYAWATASQLSKLETVTFNSWLKQCPLRVRLQECEYRYYVLERFADLTPVPTVILSEPSQPHTFCGPNRQTTMHPKVQLRSCEGECHVERSWANKRCGCTFFAFTSVDCLRLTSVTMCRQRFLPWTAERRVTLLATRMARSESKRSREWCRWPVDRKTEREQIVRTVRLDQSPGRRMVAPGRLACR
jgi:hypothetical protein